MPHSLGGKVFDLEEEELCYASAHIIVAAGVSPASDEVEGMLNGSWR